MDSGSGFCLEDCRSNGGADFYLVIWVSADIHFVTMSFCCHGREPVPTLQIGSKSHATTLMVRCFKSATIPHRTARDGWFVTAITS